MDKETFNRYLDNLLVEAKVEAEMSDFTRAINKVISETNFDDKKQAFLFISIDNADQPEADSFISYVGSHNGCSLLLQAMEKIVKQWSDDMDK